MHMQGEPRTMQRNPIYADVASEVASFLEERLAFAVDSGVAEERICLDPGIGFGKTVEQNFELIARLDVLLALGRPVLVGFSRKSSLGRLLGDADATTGSTAASVGAAVAAYDRAATIRKVLDPSARGSDFSMPGHTFPLRAAEGAGHVEAMVEVPEVLGRLERLFERRAGEPER